MLSDTGPEDNVQVESHAESVPSTPAEECAAEDADENQVPVCTTWRMPKEKEPTGPIIYEETSDIVSTYMMRQHVDLLISSQFCFVCHNGGHLIACDEPGCRRVMCLSHIPKIQTLSKAVLKELHFRCPSCHTLKSRAHTDQEAEKAKSNPGKGKQQRKDRPATPYYVSHNSTLNTPSVLTISRLCIGQPPASPTSPNGWSFA